MHANEGPWVFHIFSSFSLCQTSVFSEVNTQSSIRNHILWVARGQRNMSLTWPYTFATFLQPWKNIRQTPKSKQSRRKSREQIKCNVLTREIFLNSSKFKYCPKQFYENGIRKSVCICVHIYVRIVTHIHTHINIHIHIYTTCKHIYVYTYVHPHNLSIYIAECVTQLGF